MQPYISFMRLFTLICQSQTPSPWEARTIFIQITAHPQHDAMAKQMFQTAIKKLMVMVLWNERVPCQKKITPYPEPQISEGSPAGGKAQRGPVAWYLQILLLELLHIGQHLLLLLFTVLCKQRSLLFVLFYLFHNVPLSPGRKQGQSGSDIKSPSSHPHVYPHRRQVSQASFDKCPFGTLTLPAPRLKSFPWVSRARSPQFAVF